MISFLLILAVVLQALAVSYGLALLARRRGAVAGWLFLLGAMSSMLAWRITVMLGIEPPVYFNPAIAIWGSTCMLAAMYFFGQEVVRRRQAEAERDALLTSERAARETAERASRLKDDFLATASHELRTPLSVILSWCAIVKSGRAGRSETDKAFEIIERNARIQSRLVDDLLDVTRMQAGNLQLEMRAVPLDVPVRAALQSVLPTAEVKNVTVSMTVDDPPPVVVGDASRLQQIAGNLLTNAIKFTPAGGHIRIAIETANERGRLTVQDDGEGIDAEFLPRLFGRFQQADSSTTRRHGGLGLGLSIVAHLTRLHGGAVTAHSAGRGHGAVFTVELPAIELAAASTTTANAASDAPGLAGIRILLVDDERDVREATATLLRQLDAEVVMLDSGRYVLDELERFRPHILVLDIGMPGEDGYSLVERIRREGGPHAMLPAISLTAHAREEDRARALAAGFHDHLAKPIDVKRLAVTIRRLVSASATADAPAAATA